MHKVYVGLVERTVLYHICMYQMWFMLLVTMAAQSGRLKFTYHEHLGVHHASTRLASLPSFLPIQ